MTDAQLKQLNEHYGSQNVEATLIFVVGARNPQGRPVRIEPTYELVREILDAVHKPMLGMIADPSSVRL